MPVSPQTHNPQIDRLNGVARTVRTAGACCLLFSVAADAGQLGTKSFASSAGAYWVAPVDEAPAFISNSSNLDVALSDVRFVTQGWRWSPGSTAWIAVLVRVDALECVGLARIGGLYGP